MTPTQDARRWLGCVPDPMACTFCFFNFFKSLINDDSIPRIMMNGTHTKSKRDSG